MCYKWEIERFLKILGNKWIFFIINELLEGTKRFKELEKSLEGISAKTLTEKLRKLEKEFIIERKIYAEIPPKVEYSLTKKGRELQSIFDDLRDWETKHIKNKIL